MSQKDDVETTLSEWRTVKARPGAGARVLTAAFAELGIERRPFAEPRRSGRVAAWLERLAAAMNSPLQAAALALLLVMANVTVDAAFATVATPSRPSPKTVAVDGPANDRNLTTFTDFDAAWTRSRLTWYGSR